MVKFHPEQHLYIDSTGKQLLGVTTLSGAMKEEFDRIGKAAKCSTRKPGRWPNKWYGLSIEEILAAWDTESKRSTDLGHWYHNKREQEILSNEYYEGLLVIRPIMQDGIKIAPEQRLTDGVYPEHMVYLESANLCGQSDLVIVRDSVVTIRDYKTSKEITTEGFTNWEGVKKKMLKPLHHLDECHLNTYALQLSIYMYMILRHNPLMSAGKMYIDHVKFREAGRDKWDYPITWLGTDGEPEVIEVTQIEVPYLKSEVITLLKWLKDNKDKVIKHK